MFTALHVRFDAPNTAAAQREPDAVGPFELQDDQPRTGVNPPWGELVVQEIEIERPEEYADFDAEPARDTWALGGYTKEKARELLVRVKMEPAQIERALSASMLTEDANGIAITPDEQLVLSLSETGREQLYRALSADPRNRYMRDPARLRVGDVERWFAGSTLSPGALALIQKLVYARGEVINFSDYPLVLQHINDTKERVEFSKVLSRQHALLVKLRVRPDTDLDRVLGYWAVGGVHSKDLRPLLESLKRLPNGGSLNVAYALPPFARQRLYTFAAPVGKADSRTMNCHWSTLNFFNEQPDDRMADPAYAVPYVENNFWVIAHPSRFGDRIFLVNSRGEAVHSAVYIADDIVFTKNGQGIAQPWLLMHMKDMVSYYSSLESISVVIYRERSR